MTTATKTAHHWEIRFFLPDPSLALLCTNGYYIFFVWCKLFSIYLQNYLLDHQRKQDSLFFEVQTLCHTLHPQIADYVSKGKEIPFLSVDFHHSQK